MASTSEHKQPSWNWLLWLIPIPLVLWVLSSVPLGEIAALMRGLSPTELAALLSMNVLIVLIFSARWWIVLRGQGFDIPFTLLGLYRLASFAVSYFTPGPQFGGEPVQVVLLHRRHNVPTSSALASVTLEKTIELVVNGLFIVIAAIVVFRSRLLPDFGPGGLVTAGVILALPVGFLGAVWLGIRPVTPLLERLPGAMRETTIYTQVHTALLSTEHEMIGFCQQQRGAVLFAFGVSLLSWILVVAEYALAVSFLGAALAPVELLTLVLAARVAILLPSPGGLGAVEASQVLVMEALGYEPVLGLGVSLLIRARDIVFGTVGLSVLAIGGLIHADSKHNDGTVRKQ